jgi:hypothetical protein
MPKHWGFVPPQPGENSLFGKYDPKNGTAVSIGREENVWLHAWFVQFDRRPKPEPEVQYDEDGEVVVISFEREYRDINDWITSSGHVPGNGWRELEDEREALKAKDKKVQAERRIFTAFGGSAERPEIRAYAAVYKLSDDVDLAIVFNGPGVNKKWKNYEKAFEKLAKTFERVEVEEIDLSDYDFVNDGSPRSERKAFLLDQIRRQPGWELYETENYLVISHNNDKEFMEELLERAEEIRAIYVKDYPPETARRVSKDDEKKPKGPGGPGEDDDGQAPGDDEEDDEGLRSVSVQADPFEEARASVIRVCKDNAEYNSYGGPGGSAGYWSSWDRELVIYDAQKTSGRDDTWRVLNHEAFHQYIYYFYGELAPHSWYNEGTGDFYSGYTWKYGRFILKPFHWRLPLIAEMIRTDKYVPLEEIVRYSQQQYYGSSEYGTSGGHHYAEGWALIWFLRTGKKNARCWNEAWDHILDTYLETLADTGDLDRAVDVAFQGVDWEEMEECWKSYIMD